MELAIVQDVFKGRDGQPRAATVKVASGGSCTTILNRPVQLLYPLEIHCESEEMYLSEKTNPEWDVTNPDEDVSEEVNQEICPARPGRTAARNADAIRRVCMEDEFEGDWCMSKWEKSHVRTKYEQ